MRFEGEIGDRTPVHVHDYGAARVPCSRPECRPAVPVALDVERLAEAIRPLFDGPVESVSLDRLGWWDGDLLALTRREIAQRVYAALSEPSDDCREYAALSEQSEPRD